MMYHKAKLFGDSTACNRVLSASNSREAKAIISTCDRVLVEASPVDPIWGSGLA